MFGADATLPNDLKTKQRTTYENKAKGPADKTTKCVFSLSSVFSFSFVFRQAGYFELRIDTVVDRWRNSESQDVTSPSLRGLHGCLLNIIKELLSFHAHLSKLMLLNMKV